jgi:hypothetical protein
MGHFVGLYYTLKNSIRIKYHVPNSNGSEVTTIELSVKNTLTQPPACYFIIQ